MIKGSFISEVVNLEQQIAKIISKVKEDLVYSSSTLNLYTIKFTPSAILIRFENYIELSVYWQTGFTEPYVIKVLRLDVIYPTTLRVLENIAGQLINNIDFNN